MQLWIWRSILQPSGKVCEVTLWFQGTAEYTTETRKKEPSTQEKTHFYICLLPCSTLRQRVEDPCTFQKVLDVPMMSLHEWDTFFWDNTLWVTLHCYSPLGVCCPLCDTLCDVLSCPFSTWLPWRPIQAGGRVNVQLDSNKVYLLIFQFAQSFSGDENMMMN